MTSSRKRNKSVCCKLYTDMKFFAPSERFSTKCAIYRYTPYIFQCSSVKVECLCRHVCNPFLTVLEVFLWIFILEISQDYCRILEGLDIELRYLADECCKINIP